MSAAKRVYVYKGDPLDIRVICSRDDDLSFFSWKHQNTISNNEIKLDSITSNSMTVNAPSGLEINGHPLGRAVILQDATTIATQSAEIARLRACIQMLADKEYMIGPK